MHEPTACRFTIAPPTPSLMCKRAVEKYRNEPKRARHAQPTYTQGPLDEVFGQHRAFPSDTADLSDDMSQVHQYLASVRKEAENDSVCHFIERKSNQTYKTEQTLPFKRTERGLSPLSRQYVTSIVDQLNCEKKKSPAARREIDISISASQIDLESRSDTEASDQDATNEDVVLSEEASHESTATSDPDKQSSESCKASCISSEPSEPSEKCNSEPDFPGIPDSAVRWRQLVFTTPAPPQEYFQQVLEHPTVIKLIVYYTKWLSAAMPTSLAEWIFATFVRLDCGLDHQELAIVRTLGVKAQKLREKFLEGAAEGAHVSPVAQSCVDMVLAVVSRYYGQKDLVSEI